MRRIVLHIGNDGKLSAIPMPSNVSSTVLDMRALEVPSSPPAVHKDDTEIHHLLDDNLFQPRIKFTRYRKQMLPEVETQRPFHHKARLHLRKLMSPKRVTNGRRKSDMFEYDTIMSQNKTVALNTPNEHAKPRKNVSFADMAEVTIRIQEATPEPEKKSEDSGSEDGIYFTVKGDQATGGSKKDDDSEGNLPLPWKSAPSDTELSHAQDVAEPAASYQLKPLPSNQVLTKPEKALVDDCLSPIPPPWKNNGERNEVEPIIIQSTPYADETAVKTEVEDDEAEKVICSSIPPPWRQLSNSSMDFIGSPSIACTLDSMRPHPSTHSFHISEAESHHSKHMHMHNLIDIPNHPPHNDYEHECDVSDTELDLGEDQYEGEEICSRWLLSCEPDIDLPVNDKEYDSEECGNIDNEMNTILLHSMSNCSTNEPEEDAHSKSEQNDCCSSSKKEGLHINAVESTTCL